jgi:hypothetical protein
LNKKLYIPIDHSIFEGKNLYALLCIWVHGYKEGVRNYQKKGKTKEKSPINIILKFKRMKIKNLALASLFGLFIILAGPSKAQAQSADPFLGTWALDLDYENSNAGWIEITQEDGYLDAAVLWRGGSVNPVDFVYTAENRLILTRSNKLIREKDKAGEPVREHLQIIWFDIQKEGSDMISGKGFFPNENGIGSEAVSFTGKRIPGDGPAPDLGDIKFGKKITLLNGKDLSGWELLEPNSVSGWKVIDGVLVNDPAQKEGEPHIQYGNLRTTETFEDFNLKLEVNVPKGSNSGVYLRGIYEVQVMDSYGNPLDSHNMGALYSRIVPLLAAEKPAGEWQEMDITLYKRHLTVLLNGKMIIDNQPVRGVTGGAMTANEFIPGPIYLQGDHGNVSYRNMVLIPILD